MAHAEWGEDPEFFGPRHAHREDRILRALSGRGQGSGLHLECAAGVGSLSLSLAVRGYRVVAADLSLRSLAEARRRAAGGRPGARVLPVVATILYLPFRTGTFASASSAETLEHIDDDTRAAGELARVLTPGGLLVGTVPAGPRQWSAWDEWAGHRRRYTREAMARLLGSAGLDAHVTVWGWPLVRIYDTLFLRRVNRRRLASKGPLESDPTLRTVAGLGRRRRLVRVVRAALSVDRLFDGLPWGVGLLFNAHKRS